MLSLWSADWATQRLVLRCFGIRELRRDAVECVLSCSDVRASFEDDETRKAMLSSDAALDWVALLILEGEGCCRETWDDSLTRTTVLASASKRLTDEAMTIIRAWTKEKPQETFHTSALRQLVTLAAHDEKSKRIRKGALDILQMWRTRLPSEFAAKLKNEFCRLKPLLLLPSQSNNNDREDHRSVQQGKKRRRPLEELISGI